MLFKIISSLLKIKISSDSMFCTYWLTYLISFFKFELGYNILTLFIFTFNIFRFSKVLLVLQEIFYFKFILKRPRIFIIQINRIRFIISRSDWTLRSWRSWSSREIIWSIWNIIINRRCSRCSFSKIF